MFKKLLTLAPVCLALSACVIYAPTYVSQPSTTVVHYEATSTSSASNSNVKQKTIEVSKRVVPKVQATTQRKLADCGTFTLPREAAPKNLTLLELEAATSATALDQLLGLRVIELQTYIDSMHSKIEQAHVKWLESCQKKLLD